jgi:hypothetical protein
MTQAQYLDCINRFLFDTGFGAFGTILIVGALRRWKWLVDPPLGLSPYYSQAKLKEMFGPTAVVYFSYFLGLLLLASAGYLAYRDLQWCRLLSHPPPHWVRPSSWRR